MATNLKEQQEEKPVSALGGHLSDGMASSLWDFLLLLLSFCQVLRQSRPSGESGQRANLLNHDLKVHIKHS